MAGIRSFMLTIALHSPWAGEAISAREATTDVVVYGPNKMLNHGKDRIEDLGWCGGGTGVWRYL